MNHTIGAMSSFTEPTLPESDARRAVAISGPGPRTEGTASGYRWAQEVSPRRRRVLPQRSAYVLAAAVIGLCLFGSVVPSPLYALYAAAWHFSSLTVTLVYATYAFGVLAALLLAGRVSDQIGRR